MSAEIDAWVRRHLRDEKGIWKEDSDWFLLLALDERSAGVRRLDAAIFKEYSFLVKLVMIHLCSYDSVFIEDFWKRVKSDLDEMKKQLQKKKLGYSYFSPASRFDEMFKCVEGLLNVVWYRLSPERQNQETQKQLPPPR